MRHNLLRIAGAALGFATLAMAARAQDITAQPPSYTAPNGVTKLLTTPAAVVGYDTGTGLKCWIGSSPTCTINSAAPAATYVETTVSVSAGAWTLAVAANPSRKMVVVGDAVGAGCVLSFNASPISGEGFAFSLSGSPGAWTLDAPIATNAIYVKCTAAAVVTVAAA